MKRSAIAVCTLAVFAALSSGCVSRTYVTETRPASAVGTPVVVSAPAADTTGVLGAPAAAAVVTTTPVPGTLCRDGTMLPPNSLCFWHGGVQSNVTAAVPAAR
jgi:hypothetical protein